MTVYLTILQFVTLLSTAAIFFRAEPIVNMMGTACHLPTRVAFWSLTVGSAWLAFSILVRGYQPSGAITVLLMGVAVLLVAERRVRNLLRMPPKPVSHDRRVSS